jgi:hypothetical protein
MAQSGFTPISIYYSATASSVPLAANLVAGELALNTNDGKLYYKNSSNVVTLLAGATSGPAGGSNTQIQFNSSGVLAGSASLTWNGTTLSSSSITNTGLTSGRVVYSTTGGLETDSANLLYSGTDLTVYGVRVGRGAGAVASNTAVGASALLNNSSGTENTAMGDTALRDTTTGVYNSAFGRQALALNVGGSYNTAVGGQALYFGSGSNNTAIGRSALFGNTADNNTAVGYQSLYTNTTGTNLAALGKQALYNNSTGNNNTALGYEAGYTNNASDLTVVGSQALKSNTTGGANTAVGAQALTLNTTGGNNNAFGYATLGVNTTGGNNTALGHQALAANTTASNNTAVGYQSLYANTTGSPSVAVGYQALNANTTGANNVAVGYQAMAGNTTGGNNTALGQSALQFNNASNNTAVGYQAGYNTTSAASNCYFGYQAGYTLTASSGGNTFVGQQAGFAFNSASNGFHVMVGYNAGSGVTTGLSNTFLGANAGYGVTTGGKNVIIGAYQGSAAPISATGSNYIVLSDGDGNVRQTIDSSGNLLVGTTSTSVTSGGYNFLINDGGTGYSTGYIGHITGCPSGYAYLNFKYAGTTVGTITQNGTTGVLYNLTSDYRLKNNAVALTGAKDFVMALQPKTWDWWDGSGKGVGFIAHEFMEVAKHSGSGEKDAMDADNKPIHQAIQPSSSEVMENLVAFIQEQQALITSLTARIAALEST